MQQSFSDLYKNLHSALLELDKERESKLYFVIPFGAILLFADFYFSRFFDLVVWGEIPSFDESSFYVLIFQIAAPFIILPFLYKRLKKYMHSYRLKFKTIIIKPILTALADEVDYNYDRRFNSKEELLNSEFLFERPTHLGGEDLVKGKIEGIDFSFSEISAFHISGSGKSRTELNLMNGIFFMATFPRILAKKINIQGRARMILPKEYSILKHLSINTVIILAAIILGVGVFVFLNYTANEIIRFFEKRFVVFIILGWFLIAFIILFFKSIYKKIENFFNFRRLVKIDMENISLDENYTVYSEVKSDIRIIQFQHVQEALIELQKRTATSTSLHIRGEKVYIYIPESFDIFEPKWFKKNADPKVIRESYDLVKGLRDLIFALKVAMENFTPFSP